MSAPASIDVSLERERERCMGGGSFPACVRDFPPDSFMLLPFCFLSLYFIFAYYIRILRLKRKLSTAAGALAVLFSAAFKMPMPTPRFMSASAGERVLIYRSIVKMLS